MIAHYDHNVRELRVAHWDGTSFSGESIDTGEDSEDESGTLPADTGKFAKHRNRRWF